MGGVVDYGLGLDTKTSPRRAAIEKAQAELRSVVLYMYIIFSVSLPLLLNFFLLFLALFFECFCYRQEYDVREERKRELEFLEKVFLDNAYFPL